MGSIAKRVAAWVEERPCIRYALAKGLINYSAVARLLMEEEGIRNFDAVVVALRRYREGLQKVRMIEGKQRKVLAASTLEIRTGINIYILSKRYWAKEAASREALHLIEGRDFFMLITESGLEGPGILRRYEGMVEVRVKSPEAIETTPGVVFLIYEKLFEYGINIVETYSSWRDTVIVIAREDLEATLKALHSLGVR